MAVTFGASLWAQPVEVLSPNESIYWVKNNKIFPVSMEVTVFKPQGDGPYPVVVIHHGKSLGNNRLQPREHANFCNVAMPLFCLCDRVSPDPEVSQLGKVAISKAMAMHRQMMYGQLLHG